MSNIAVILDQFEDPKAGAEFGGGQDVFTQRIKAAAYAEGFAAGEAGADAKQSATKNFLHGVEDAIKDAVDSFSSEIDARVCDSLRVLLQSAFPKLSEMGFAVEAVESIKQDINTSNQPSLALFASPERIPLLEEIIKQEGLAAHISLSADQSKTRNQASVEWQNAGFDIDVESACANLLKSLERISQRYNEGNGE